MQQLARGPPCCMRKETPSLIQPHTQVDFHHPHSACEMSLQPRQRYSGRRVREDLFFPRAAARKLLDLAPARWLSIWLMEVRLGAALRQSLC